MDDILNKVRKMMNLAHGEGASEGEIENALRMARKLMTEYGITEEQLNVNVENTTEITDEIGAQRCGFQQWEQSLAGVIGNICDVGTYRKRRPSMMDICFYGFKHDVAVAREVYATMLVSVKLLARMRCGKGWTSSHRSYADGFVAGLQAKAYDMKRQATQENAIILRKDIIVSKWAQEHLNLRVKKARAIKKAMDFTAYDKGRSDGYSANVRNTMGPGSRGAIC